MSRRVKPHKPTSDNRKGRGMISRELLLNKKRFKWDDIEDTAKARLREKYGELVSHDELFYK